jgi:hypothetical protein
LGPRTAQLSISYVQMLYVGSVAEKL